jgi:hypothetical protein
MIFGISVGAAIAAPFVVYGIYRIYDHYHKDEGAEKLKVNFQ